jgi:hypothetical protein
MKNLTMYCISLKPNHLEKIKQIGYIPVGLGNKNFSSEWTKDNTHQNISSKNSFFGEYTFHYWLWKNDIENLHDGWIGFCQYRKFWSAKKNDNKILSINDLNKIILKEIDPSLNNYDAIIGSPFFVNNFKLSKFIKNNFKEMVRNPSLFFVKSKRNIKFHFDMMHGQGNLEKAINLLGNEDKNDFLDFVNSNVSFNPHNMFICKSKEILKKYYESIFPWLESCEKEFGFKGLEGYGLQRLYGFLAERYMSYWFQKNTNFKILPIVFKDISDFN